VEEQVFLPGMNNQQEWREAKAMRKRVVKGQTGEYTFFGHVKTQESMSKIFRVSAAGGNGL
jgi:hypothetical protein